MRTSERLLTKSISDVCLHPDIGGGFFEGVCVTYKATTYSSDPPPSIRESRLRKGSIRTLARLLHSYVVCRPFGVVSGRSHKETWAGCIVSLTTPTRLSFSASRSVSSLSVVEKASRVFLASYFLL